MEQFYWVSKWMFLGKYTDDHPQIMKLLKPIWCYGKHLILTVITFIFFLSVTEINGDLTLADHDIMERQTGQNLQTNVFCCFFSFSS